MPLPAVVLGLALRSTVESEAGPLLVSHREFGNEVSIESVLDGSAPALVATLTSDGRGAITNAWHEGVEHDWVYVERWTYRGRVFHGWVDSASRKILQAG